MPVTFIIHKTKGVSHAKITGNYIRQGRRNHKTNIGSPLFCVGKIDPIQPRDACIPEQPN
jgi:hypothetical protein